MARFEERSLEGQARGGLLSCSPPYQL